MFMFESLSFLAPSGIILENMFSRASFSTLTPGFLRTFNPQNVKNIVTSLPIDAAPVAMINEAIALSRSPLNTTIVAPFFSFTTGALVAPKAGATLGVSVPFLRRVLK